jgi:hypothetical protein
MKKFVVVSFLFVVATVAMATTTPFDLQYSVTPKGGGVYAYNFDLKYNGTGGDQLGWLMPGAKLNDPNNPTCCLGQWGGVGQVPDFTVTSGFSVGPWTSIDFAGGDVTGPVFINPFDFWAPNPGASLTWTAASHADLAGSLTWFYLDEEFNGHFQAGTYVSQPTPEAGTLIMFGSGILGLSGVLRRKINL